MNVFDEIGLNPDDLDRTFFGKVAKTLIRTALPDVESKFEIASIAAEGWLNIVAAVGHFCKADKPNVDAAYKLLMPTNGEAPHYNLLDSYREHSEILHQTMNRLNAVSDGPVEEEPLAPGECPMIWSSAHEAATSLARRALEMLVCPVAMISDPAEQWRAAERCLTHHWRKVAKSPAKVAALQERIRRERAKLLDQEQSESKGGGRPTKGKTNLLALAPGGFALRGKCYPLTGRPLEMLRLLLNSPHHSATADQLRKDMAVNDLDVTYPDQVIKDTARKLRAALKKAAKVTNLPCSRDPLPSTGRGRDLSYRLAPNLFG